jgi:hypothetical protein
MAVAASGSNQAARMLGHANSVIYPASRIRSGGPAPPLSNASTFKKIRWELSRQWAQQNEKSNLLLFIKIWWVSLLLRTAVKLFINQNRGVFHSNRQGVWCVTRFTYSTFRQRPNSICVTPSKIATFSPKISPFCSFQAVFRPAWRFGGSTEARVTRDRDQNSCSTGGCVTCDCQFELKSPVSSPCVNRFAWSGSPASPLSNAPIFEKIRWELSWQWVQQNEKSNLLLFKKNLMSVITSSNSCKPIKGFLFSFSLRGVVNHKQMKTK